MINFKLSEDSKPNALILAALVLLCASLAYVLLVKPPKIDDVTRDQSLTKRRMYDEISEVKLRAVQSRKAIAPRVWSGDSVTVTAGILGQLASEASAHSLQLDSFRPEKELDLIGFSDMEYTVQFSGPYPEVKELLVKLDKGDDRIAVESAQVASSQLSTDEVTATLRISAYRVTDPTLASAPGGGHG